VAAAHQIFGYGTWVPGWNLVSAECSARTQACTRDWVRRGGTFEDLRRALPDDALEMLVPQGSTVPALDVARTRRPFKVVRESLRVDLGEGSDARGLLKFSATGVFYVAAR